MGVAVMKVGSTYSNGVDKIKRKVRNQKITARHCNLIFSFSFGMEKVKTKKKKKLFIFCFFFFIKLVTYSRLENSYFLQN